MNNRRIFTPTNTLNPEQNFEPTTYTGNGGSSALEVNFSGAFQPDLLWLKRTNATKHHLLFSSAYPNVTDATRPSTSSGAYTTGQLSSFDSDGFTLAAVADNNINNNGSAHTAYGWKAGGNSDTFNIDGVGYSTASAAGLDGGTLTPTSATINTQTGISIITIVDGASDGTISHGLGVAPDMIWFKRVDSGEDWHMYHSSVGELKELKFNDEPGVTFADTNVWNDTAPTSTLVHLDVNFNGAKDYMMICWANVDKYQKFGTYSGGQSTVSVIDLGFQPRFLAIKGDSTDTVESFNIYDSANKTITNKFDKFFQVGSPTAQQSIGSGSEIRIESNGFGFQSSNSPGTNKTGITYYYWAIA